MSTPWWRAWAPDVALALVVVALGLYEISSLPYDGAGDGGSLVLVTLAFAAAVGLSRHAPGVALALVWATCALQVGNDVQLLYVQASIAVVAFGTARWGSVPTLVLSALSIPACALIGVLGVLTGAIYRGFGATGGYEELVRAAYRFSDSWQVGAVFIGMALLGVPWLAGLTLRFMARARHSEVRQEAAEADAARAQHETEQAREIAQLREEQARMARDVHDVVGHSLAVILAQAESGQYLPDDDPETLKKTMATIATSARSSLQDVRHVLTGSAGPEPARTGAFEGLIEGVRASGHEVLATEVGTPQPLPPELEVAAHRVAQEMLTNAIKHGRRDRPVHVERHWPEGVWGRDLRIEVRNVEDLSPGEPALDETQPMQAVGPPGQGLDGMRRRLEAVGGRLDVRRREEGGEPTFTATAWVPVSGR